MGLQNLGLLRKKCSPVAKVSKIGGGLVGQKNIKVDKKEKKTWAPGKKSNKVEAQW